ncbi:lipid-binding protein [Petrimonas sp.]|uniref:lipid-binding protein n=1 Tax=Petrimonas sp. TaxID=2023866 RepID=UPI003F5187C6
MKLKKIVILFVTAAFLLSCQHSEKEVSEAPETAINAVGEWNVSAYLNDSQISKPFTLIILNDISSKADSIILKDISKDFWDFQVKAAIDNTKDVFETKMSNCEVSDFNIGIKIPNGKIINSDSIYLEIQFEDDVTPYGNTYTLKGHRVK